MRDMAAERDITVLELSAIAERDDGAIDGEIDTRSRAFGNESDNLSSMPDWRGTSSRGR